MRVVLVGDSSERRRLRSALSDLPFEIVGEAATLATARADASGADAFLVAASPDDDERTAQVESLTPREMEVLQLLAEGLPNKAIAVELGISDQTVKFHVASIAGKLGAANRTDAVRLALQQGLVTL